MADAPGSWGAGARRVRSISLNSQITHMLFDPGGIVCAVRALARSVPSSTSTASLTKFGGLVTVKPSRSR